MPLAERMRPKSLDEIVGQAHILGKDGVLSLYAKQGYLPSMLFWGPPGSGKTTIAQLLARLYGARFVSCTAVNTSVSELKKHFSEAEEAKKLGFEFCLFVDEIHRFSRSQQDVLLQEVELGTIHLIAASTENPGFEINSALLSRLQIFVLETLSIEDLRTIFFKAMNRLTENTLTGKTPTENTLTFEEEAREFLLSYAQGDARRLLNCMEQCITLYQNKKLAVSDIERIISYKQANYSKSADLHYNLISALHKSIRGSDCDASLYWFSRMIDGGEDPHYIARRLLRVAYEDIGLSDPQAPRCVLDAWDCFQRLGSPEGELALAQAVVYLALSPKSNRVYRSFTTALRFAKKHSSEAVPKHILNAPLAIMKKWGYGKGYEYDHDKDEGFSGQRYFPDEVASQKFYVPLERGYERELKKRIDYFDALRKRLADKGARAQRENDTKKPSTS